MHNNKHDDTNENLLIVRVELLFYFRLICCIYISSFATLPVFHFNINLPKDPSKIATGYYVGGGMWLVIAT